MKSPVAIRILVALVLCVVLTAVSKASGAGQVTVSFDTGTKKVFSDQARSAALSAGSEADGDGCVVELGYYRAANAGNKFAGEWVALTGETSRNSDYQRTSIGDTSANGASAGTVAFSSSFVVGSSTAGNDLPAPGTPLAVRFYNARTVAAATGFNVASSQTWTWRAPQPAPANPVVNLSLDDAGVEWLGGADSALVTSQSTGHGQSTDPVAAPTGTYQALISPTGSGENRGMLTVRLLGSRGNFSAVIALEGRRYRFRGILDENGRWQGLAPRAGNTLHVSLVVIDDQLEGNVTFPDGTASAIGGSRLATASVNNPSPRQGAYTLVLMPSPEAPPGSPTVPGFATMEVNARGAVRINGLLPDGTAFSAGAQMLSDDRLQLHLPRTSGGVFGEIVFRDQPQISDADGVFHWVDRRQSMLPLNVIVSKYDPKTLVLTVNTSAAAQAAGNLQLTIARVGDEPPLTKPATLTPSNDLFIPNPHINEASLSLSARSGILRGSFNNPSDRRAKLSGAIFQKQQLGVGQFRDGGKLGEIELNATGD